MHHRRRFLSLSSSLRGPTALRAIMLACFAAACGVSDGSDDTEVDSLEADEQASAAEESTLRQANLPEYKDTRDAFRDISKRIMGVDPKTDKVTHYGLVELARMLGYGWTYNWCNDKWNWGMGASQGKLAKDVSDKAKAHFNDKMLYITSNHKTGSGYGCSEGPERDNPAMYTFNDWVLADSSVQRIPWSKDELPDGDGGSVSLDTNGVAKVEAPLTFEVDTGLNKLSKSITAQIGVDQAISLSSTITKGWSNSWKIGATFTNKWSAGLFGTGTEFTVAVSSDYTRQESESEAETQSTTITPKCNFSVEVPPKCHYKGKIVVSKERRIGRFKANLSVKPQTVGITGFMRLKDGNGCMRRGLKKGDGRDPDGTCGKTRKTVNEIFGDPNGLLFYEDIEQQRSTDSGSWYWHLLTGIEEYNHNGTPMVDLAIREFNNESIYRFSLPFSASEETVTSCKLELDVADDSDDSCKAPSEKTAPAK